MLTEKLIYLCPQTLNMESQTLFAETVYYVDDHGHISKKWPSNNQHVYQKNVAYMLISFVVLLLIFIFRKGAKQTKEAQKDF